MKAAVNRIRTDNRAKKYALEQINVKGFSKAGGRATNIVNKKLYSAPAVIEGTITRGASAKGAFRQKW